MKDAIKYLEDTLVTGNNTDDVIAVLAWKISNFSPEQQAYICAGEIYLGDNLVLFIPPEEEETVSPGAKYVYINVSSKRKAVTINHTTVNYVVEDIRRVYIK